MHARPDTCTRKSMCAKPTEMHTHLTTKGRWKDSPRANAISIPGLMSPVSSFLPSSSQSFDVPTSPTLSPPSLILPLSSFVVYEQRILWSILSSLLSYFHFSASTSSRLSYLLPNYSLFFRGRSSSTLPPEDQRTWAFPRLASPPFTQELLTSQSGWPRFPYFVITNILKASNDRNNFENKQFHLNTIIGVWRNWIYLFLLFLQGLHTSYIKCSVVLVLQI